MKVLFAFAVVGLIMLQRTMMPLVDTAGVKSVTLFENDGFVIYRSNDDTTNEDGQMSRWISALDASPKSNRLTFIMEHCSVILHRGERLHLAVHCGPSTNLGEVRQTAETCHESLHNLA